MIYEGGYATRLFGLNCGMRRRELGHVYDSHVMWETQALLSYYKEK